MFSLAKYQRNANNTTMRYHLTLVRMEIIKNSANNKCWRRVEEREPSYTVTGSVGWLPQWWGREEIDWEFGVSICKPVYIEWINNKAQLCSMRNYIQYPVINHNGKECKEEFILKNLYLYQRIYMCIYIYICKIESLCWTAEILKKHCKSPLLSFFKKHNDFRCCL